MRKLRKTTGGFQKIVITHVSRLISDVCDITEELAPAADCENPKSRLSHSASASFQSKCSELRLSGPQSSPSTLFCACYLHSLWSPFSCFQPAFWWQESQNTSAVSGVDFSGTSLSWVADGNISQGTLIPHLSLKTTILRLFSNPVRFTLSE